MNEPRGAEHPAGLVIRELRRRRVGRVALGYLAVAYAAVEAAHAFFPGMSLPDWAFRAVLGAAALGFPLATVLAWDFDIDGGEIVRTGEEEGSVPVPHRPRLPWLSFVGFWVLVGMGVRFLT